MNALIGLVVLELFVVLAVALYVDCRRPKPPLWAGDTFVFTTATPALVLMLALGGGVVVDALISWERKGIAAGDIPLVTASLAATALLLVALRPRRRLARYAALRAVVPASSMGSTVREFALPASGAHPSPVPAPAPASAVAPPGSAAPWPTSSGRAA